MTRIVWATITLGALSLAACGNIASHPSFETSGGSRPQRIAHSARANHFVGDWGPIERYVANDWLVRFSEDGRVSVKGPGMISRGTYAALGRDAEAQYNERDGGTPYETDMAVGHFSLSADGTELTFETGIKNDAPVHLNRIGIRQSFR